MIVKFLAAIIAVLLLLAYLVPVALKLKEISLAAVMLVGVVMMLVDVWQSLQHTDS
jgi:hypothetical protein